MPLRKRPLRRGKVGDFEDLPVRTRRSYLRLGIVQAYFAADLPVPSATSRRCKNREQDLDGSRQGGGERTSVCRLKKPALVSFGFWFRKLAV